MADTMVVINQCCPRICIDDLCRGNREDTLCGGSYCYECGTLTAGEAYCDDCSGIDLYDDEEFG